MADGLPIPEDLRAGLRAVRDVQAAEILRPWTWDPSVGRWVFPCHLTPPVAPGGLIPEITVWYVLADAQYPRGSVVIYPAKEGGISQTFPHQSYNAKGTPQHPWRTGDLCLTTGVRVLNHRGLDTEPFDSYHRLRWHVERALAWLEAASFGNLAAMGDYFELPQLPTSESSRNLIAFHEDASSFQNWHASSVRVGLVDLSRLRHDPDVHYVRSFLTLHRKDIHKPRWGHTLAQTSVSETGIWVRLNECPIIPPWQAPATWAQFRQAVSAQGLDLDRLLKAAAGRVRDGKFHPLLVGFPIPDRIGDVPAQMQWLAVKLPILSRGARTADGFRPNEQGYWHRDRTDLIADPRPVLWQTTENWSQRELTARGRLPEGIAGRSVAIIGAGALGSAVAELLIRAGINSITVIDSDLFNAGNLVRHNLLLQDIKTAKAAALAARLNAASPHADARAVVAHFPNLDEVGAVSVQEADIVLDCTGSDEVLQAMAAYPWQTRKTFVSLSLGLHARRLYCFSVTANEFPVSAFQQKINPWLERERNDAVGEELPREGIGCWHPVFPARVDDIWMHAAMAVKQIEAVLNSALRSSELVVFEQVIDETGFTGVQRVAEAATEPEN